LTKASCIENRPETVKARRQQSPASSELYLYYNYNIDKKRIPIVIESSDADYAPRITAHVICFLETHLREPPFCPLIVATRTRNPGESATSGSEDSRSYAMLIIGVKQLLRDRGAKRGNMVK
jgi:hypothetical protein